MEDKALTVGGKILAEPWQGSVTSQDLLCAGDSLRSWFMMSLSLKLWRVVIFYRKIHERLEIIFEGNPAGRILLFWLRGLRNKGRRKPCTADYLGTWTKAAKRMNFSSTGRASRSWEELGKRVDFYIAFMFRQMPGFSTERMVMFYLPDISGVSAKCTALC